MSGADRMRERLRELGRSADRELASELDARIVEHVKFHGPKIVRRSRQRRALIRASVVLVPFGLGVFGWRAWEGAERSAEPVAHIAVPNAGVPAEPQSRPGNEAAERQARAGTQPCAQRGVDQSAFLASSSGRRVLELGERGRAVLERDAEATLDASDPCRLALQLERGRVTVHAENLLGGELHVKAGDADVVVRGTTFAVERAADDVTVAVAEGAVAVEREGRAVAPLVRGGQRLQVSVKQAPVLLALSEAEAVQLRATVSETVVLARAEESVSEQPRGTRRPSASSRFAAAQSNAKRLTESGAWDSEPASDEPSAGGARTIGSAAWQRALADSSAATRARAASSDGASEPTNAPDRPSEQAAAADPSPTAPNEVRRDEASGRSETPAAAETAAPARAETPAELVARADALWRRGARDDARALYRRAGSASGATAQAAWLALARRELAAGRASAARDALDGYTARFPAGALSAEAAGIEFRIALLEHDDALAERSAKRLCERYPTSPAAQAARHWLRARGHKP